MKFIIVLTFVAAALGGFATLAEHGSTNLYPCPHSGTTRLAHSWSCSKFVQCVNGVAVERDCAQGLFFNADQQQCMNRYDAQCDIENNPCPTWDNPEDLTYLTHANNCNNYFMCYGGSPLSLQCAAGLNFNSITNQCDTYSCNNADVTCPATGSDFIPHDTDCSRYFHCFDGVAYGTQCRDGLLFDQVTSRCVVSGLASCRIVTTTPEPTTQSPTTERPTTPTTKPTYTTKTTKKTTTTQKPTYTTTKKTTTTQKPTYTTTKKTTTTQKPTYTTTKKTTTTQKPTYTTTKKTTTTHKPTYTTTTTKKTTTTTTAAPEVDLDSYCKKVSHVAVVAHPERCDWYIQCSHGHGSLGKCGSYQIFSESKGRCVLGSTSTCKYADEVDSYENDTATDY